MLFDIRLNVGSMLCDHYGSFQPAWEPNAYPYNQKHFLTSISVLFRNNDNCEGITYVEQNGLNQQDLESKCPKRLSFHGFIMK